MALSFTNQAKAPYKKEIFLSVVNRVFKKTGGDKKGEISLVLTDRKMIKELNRIYRRKNKTANILTFVFRENKNFIKPKTKNYLGEIFICYPEAVKGARINKTGVGEELKRLTIHGLLHLLGYRHKNKKERARMQGMEESIIKTIN